MVGPRRQVINLVVFNLILVGFVLTTFRLDYMTYDGSVDVGFWKATYHFTHDNDPAFVRCAFEFIHEHFCGLSATDSELSSLRSFCEVISDFKIVGLSFVITCVLSLLLMVYVVVYLAAIASEAQCAKSFSPAIAQVAALTLYLISVSLLIMLSFYFDLWTQGEAKTGFVALLFSLLLLVISTAYYFTLAQGVLRDMHAKLDESNTLLTPLLKGQKETPAATPLLREKTIPPVLLREEIEKLKAATLSETRSEDQQPNPERSEGQ